MPEGEMYERMAILERMEKINEMRGTISFLENQDRIKELNAEIAKLRSKVEGLEATIRCDQEVRKDLEISLACVKAMLKTYMDFVEALNPDAKAFEKAMKKMEKK